MKVRFLPSILIILIVFLYGNPAVCQSFPQMGCDGGNRYINDLFNADSAPTTVQFGDNVTVGGTAVDLLMDIYEPEADFLAERPVIVLAFGGSFIGGDRSLMESYCRSYARKGFVTVAIDYRIYDLPLFPLPDSTDMLGIVIGAVSDMKAAVRQLRYDADTGNPFRIDPEYIFVGGVSAGAIVALHTAYFDASDALPQYILDEINLQGGFEGDSNDQTLSYSSDAQGVINYFGALNKKEWLGAGSAPISSIHGTDDDVVPYGHDFANVCVFGFCVPMITMDGSSLLHPQALSVGTPSHFISVPGAGHGTFTQETYTQFREETSLFLHNEVLCGALTSVDDHREDVSRFVVTYPNPATNEVNINFNSLNEVYTLTVYNNVGQKVYQLSREQDNEVTLPVNALGAGMFQLDIQFQNPDLAPVRKKVVVIGQ